VTGRERVRRFLQGGDADRPPFVPFVTDLAGRLSRTSHDELFSDPQALTDAFLKTVTVCELDCVVLNLGTEVVGDAAVGADPSGVRGLGVVKEGVLRLRALLGERAGLAVVLPGPLDLAAHHGRTPSESELEDLASALLKVAGHLEPPSFDALGLLEHGPIGAAGAARLADALSVLWNVARYYAMPSLFVAGEGDAAVGRIGATSVSVWRGADPSALLDGGPRVGVPIPSPSAPAAPALPPLPHGGFYTTAGEVAAETEVTWMQAASRAAAVAGMPAA
jgi:hypothetical protein